MWLRDASGFDESDSEERRAQMIYDFSFASTPFSTLSI